MSVDRFKFVSPGVFINEIDNSQPGPAPGVLGPAIIGRLERGPSNRPVTVGSMSEFVEIFGNPIAGGRGGDVWRDGNYLAPTYAAYAAMAYLRNSAPVTVVRVLGEAHDSAVAGGEAGWKHSNSHAAGTDVTPSGNGGAFGLFLFSSGSNQYDFEGSYVGDRRNLGAKSSRAKARTTGSLAAVWYFDAGAIELSGTFIAGQRATYRSGSQAASKLGAGNTAAAGNSIFFKASNTDTMEFTTVLFDNANVGKKVTFNFDRNSDKYIRKVFNTNPTLMGSAVSDSKKYFLGETFDRHAKDLHGSGTLHQGELGADPTLYGCIVGLQSTTHNWGSNQISTQPAKTGWFFGQDLSSNTTKFDAAKQQKLFRIVGLEDGEWSSRNVKVSISDHRAPNDVDPYGSFSVTLRYTRDHDGQRKVLERFSQCNLNPNSNNFIGAKIGDQYQEWDETDKRYRTYGTWPNQSRFVRVELDSDVEEGISDPAYLPFGFYGPPRYKRFTLTAVTSGELSGSTVHAINAGNATPNGGVEGALMSGSLFVSGSRNAILSGGLGAIPFKCNGIFASATTGSHTVYAGEASSVASVVFPSLPLRRSASAEGLRNDKMAHFGVSTYRSPTSTRFDESYLDIVRGGQGIAADTYDPGNNTEYSFIFTLDDVIAANSAATSVKTAFYQSGSRKAATSYTALRMGAGSGSWTELIKTGFTKFTSPMYGGFDGLNIKERAPFGNHVVGASGVAFKNNYAANSFKRAIDSVAEPEVVDINLMAVPGVREPLITDHVLRVCEDRGDALAVIDLEQGGYQPSTETTANFKTRITNNNVTDCVNTLSQRGLNTSYGCAYFPWVKIYDEINAQQVWVPPSVVALGTMASTQRVGELWFAPAGFTRGGLSEGSAGVPVLAVSQRLSAKDRDDLYENQVNPIASFPAEGIVIFGQKTLQATPSALDRINVRRLMVYLKKEISRIASRLLFEQNVQATWNKFRGQVEPFLQQVKSGFGVQEYKVVLDGTTTTPDLIDRNIMYAKIFIKPAKALEFIAIDFIVTNQGAAFDD